MKAGDLNERISIESRVEVRNRLNESTYVWATLATVFANAKPLRGREFFEAAQVQSEVTVKFTVRYRTDVDNTMSVVWKGDRYGIVAPPIPIRREWLELMCSHGIGDGKDSNG